MNQPSTYERLKKARVEIWLTNEVVPLPNGAWSTKSYMESIDESKKRLSEYPLKPSECTLDSPMVKRTNED